MFDTIIKSRATVHYLYFLHSLRKVAQLYGVSKSTLHRWIKEHPGSKKIRKPRKKKNIAKLVENIVNQTISQNPFVTMKSLANILKTRADMQCSRQTASRLVKQLGFSKKKAYRGVTYSHDINRVSTFCQNFLDAGSDVVAIDEAGFYVGECPRRGYAPRGKRLRMAAPRMRLQKLTLLLAARPSGVVGFKVLQHNCKKADFVAFLEGLDLHPGESVVMDNIRFHHSRDTLGVLLRKRCRPLFTPPYSPKANPVEYLFAAAKTAYRCISPPLCTSLLEASRHIEQCVVGSSHLCPSVFRHVSKKLKHTLDQLQESPLSFSFSGYD